MINPKTGRVHTSYHQAVTATGRLSSTDPNLQNIPVRNEEGRRIRQAFIAPEDYVIVSADYSQIELRIMAHLSRDKGLLTAFAEGKDIHRATAAEVFGLPLETVTSEQRRSAKAINFGLSRDKGLLTAFAEGKDIHRATAAEVFGLPLETVTSEQRRSAKAINFGLIYGMSAFGLARQLNIPRKEAQKYMDLYFERYPGVLEYTWTFTSNATLACWSIWNAPVLRRKSRATLKRWTDAVCICRISNPAMGLVVQRLNVQPLTRQCREPPPTLSQWCSSCSG